MVTQCLNWAADIAIVLIVCRTLAFIRHLAFTKVNAKRNRKGRRGLGAYI